MNTQAWQTALLRVTFTFSRRFYPKLTLLCVYFWAEIENVGSVQEYNYLWNNFHHQKYSCLFNYIQFFCCFHVPWMSWKNIGQEHSLKYLLLFFTEERNTYSGAKKYLVSHQLCKFSHLKRWEACNFHPRYTSTMRDKIRFKKIQKITL